MQTSALFDAKNFECFKIYGVSARTRVGSLRTFFGEGMRSNFRDFCGRLLWTALYESTAMFQ